MKRWWRLGGPCLLPVAACGGGGGDDGSLRVSFSTGTLQGVPAGHASRFKLCAALVCALLGACGTPGIERYSQSLQVGAAGTRYDDRRDALRAFVREVESADWARQARLDAPLRMIRPELPQMPPEAYRDQASGVVAVVFEITPVGNVEGVAVVSAPHAQLGEACRQAVSEWLFGPITRQGRPVRLKTRMEFQFEDLQ